jgi:hypothetical protein
VGRAAFLLEILGENVSLTFYLLEASHIPWLVAITLRSLMASPFTSLALLPPFSPYKDFMGRSGGAHP